MVNGRSRKRTPSRVTRGGITAVKIGKDDVFIFRGKKLKKGTMGIFGSKGQLRLGVFQGKTRKAPSKRRLGKGRKSIKTRTLGKTRSRSRPTWRKLK